MPRPAFGGSRGGGPGGQKGGFAETVAAEAGAEVERLIGAGPADGIDFGALERAVRDAALGIAGRLVADRLNADRSDAAPWAACGCRAGARARCAGRREKAFTTALGRMTLSRAWFHCRECGHGFSPRDRALGLAGGSLSPAPRRMVGLAAAETSFARAGLMLGELAGIRIGAKQVERHAEALGRDVARDEREAVEPGAPAADTLHMGLDGTGLPVRRGEAEGRAGKRADGSAKTREAKLAAVWSAERLDADGAPRRDPGSASFNAAIESIAGRDADPDPAPFAQRALREVERRGFQQAERRVALGDGAAWIWNFADEHLPGAVQIVDLFHAKEHLFDAAKAIYGTTSDLADQWGRARRDELDRHGPGPVIDELRRHAGHCEAARRELEYFTANRQRMDYPAFRKQGLCVTTGVVEGACKSVLGSRLKRGGMHWTVNGANAIIAFRCAIDSNRFDGYWKRRAAQS